jgi:hypothetical protein
LSLETYDDLKAAVARWLRRSDIASDIPDFISLAEADINANLRTRKMIVRRTGVASAEYAALPPDFGGIISYRLTGVGSRTLDEPLTSMSLGELQCEDRTLTGQPVGYVVIGDELRFYPIPDASYSSEMIGYKRVPALTSSSPTNWLLTRHPDVYLFGSLLQGVQFLKNDDRAQLFADRYNRALDNVGAQDSLERGPSRNRAHD